jgi:hypothetical protein
MLNAFCDDSASESDSKILVLAGYVHDATVWGLFSDDWKRVLDAKPSIEYFHMVEAENLRDQFKNWLPADRDAKVDALADVIVKHKPWSIDCSVSRSDYDRIIKPVAPYDLRNSYFPCFCGVIVKLAQWHASLGLKIPVDFVFDEQQFIGTEAMAVFFYEALNSSIEDPAVLALLGSTPVFRNDKHVLPLQAADLLAWHIRRSKETRNAHERRPIMEKLIPLEHVTAPLGETDLRCMAQDILKVPNMGFTTKKRDSIRRILKKLKLLSL